MCVLNLIKHSLKLVSGKNWKKTNKKITVNMACINDDWEHQVGVNPLLADMSCGGEEYYTTQEVSLSSLCSKFKI